MNKTVGLDIVKLNIFFMKPNNLTSLRRMSRVRLAWHGFLTILQSQLKNPHCASSLFCSVTHGKGFRQNHAVPTSLKYDFKDASERFDHLFIDTSTLK